jgi:hypothetical protein
MPFPRYTVWRDNRSGTYEVARWDSVKVAVVVQTNIRTEEKARMARDTWRKHERDRRRAQQDA